MERKTYDMIVIGAGPGGYVSAIRGAQLGMNVAVVEREHLGGICLNWGCIPTKAMLRSAEVFHLMNRADEFGLSVSSVSFKLDKVVERSRKIAGKLSGGVKHLLKKNKATVIMGEAKFADNQTISVSGPEGPMEITAPNIVVATGARARELPGIATDGDLVWSYKHALIPKRMPKSLLVIGSGAIGIEFASFFNALGANTTVVEVLDRILPNEDEEISGLAKKSFSKLGIKFHEGSIVKKLTKSGNQAEAVIESKSEKELVLNVDTVISAAGIAGNIENLGLEKIGVKTDRSHIVVDELCRTGVDGIYAIGDVAGPPWLAHKASHEGIAVAELIAGGQPHPVKPESVAGCTYCHPQIASVGLTEAEAKGKGKPVRVGRFPLHASGKAIALGEPEGLVKTIFDESSGELLGAHMIGAEVTELIHGFVVGRQLETTESELMQTVFPHPTISEAMHESTLEAFGRAVHI